MNLALTLEKFRGSSSELGETCNRQRGPGGASLYYERLLFVHTTTPPGVGKMIQRRSPIADLDQSELRCEGKNGRLGPYTPSNGSRSRYWNPSVSDKNWGNFDYLV